MERLTCKRHNSDGYSVSCSSACRGGDCGDCVEFGKIIDRLAAYEDTGLMPEEIPTAVEMAQIYSIIEENKRYRALNVTVGRIKEIAKADKEGRVVVLPCKVGDIVYWPKNQRAIVEEFFGYGEERYLHAQFFDSNEYIDIPFDEFGKSVFLTREEAEEALRRAENGNR